MRKWQIKPVRSIGGAPVRNLVFTGNDNFSRLVYPLQEPKKEALIISRLRDIVGRMIYYF